MNNTDMSKTIHHGKNLKRIREILGIKQEALAIKLGTDWHQKKVSALEEKETIEDALLSQVAEALKVPVDAIKNFSEDATVNIIASNNNGKDNSSAVNYQCTFNPIDKWLEALDENKRLYEALLKSEREKIAMLEKLLGEKKK